MLPSSNLSAEGNMRRPHYAILMASGNRSDFAKGKDRGVTEELGVIMKKALLSLLALSLVLSSALFVGCASGTGASDAPSATRDAASDDKSALKSTGADKENAQVDPVKSVKEYERGIMTDTGYESEWLDLRFALPEGYVMASEEDAMAAMRTGSESLGADEAIINHAELSTVYEMMASAPAGFPNVSVFMQKNIIALSEATVISTTKTQLEQAGYTVEEKDDTKIGNEPYATLLATTNISGVAVKQVVYFRVIDTRMVVITLSGTEEGFAEAEALLAGFGPY